MLPGRTPGAGVWAGGAELSAVADGGGSSSACFAFAVDAAGAADEHPVRREIAAAISSATML